jgi:hypothetical protein
MSMRFTPKTKEELDKERSPIADGDYDFIVASAEDRKSGPDSKNPGTPMIKLAFILFRDNGTQTKWSDILHPQMDWKIRAFCDATGKMDLYNSGELAAMDCVQAAGRLTIKNKPDRKTKEIKPEVVDYLAKTGDPRPRRQGQPQTSPTPSFEDSDDAPPF